MKQYRRISLKKLAEQYTVRKVSQGVYFDQARKLHASVYAAHGFVTNDDISGDGYLTQNADPHEQHADYFVAIDNEHDEVVALVRQIHQRAGHMLPVFEHKLTGKNYTHIHHDDIVEISAFAKKRGTDSRVTLLLFGEMLQHSRQRGHRYWVFACDSLVYRRLKTLFGRLLQKTGSEVFYMGSNVVPAEVDLDRALHQLRSNYRYSVPPLRQVRKFLHDSMHAFSVDRESRRPRTSQTIFWDYYAKAYDGLLHLEPYRHLVDHVSDLALASHPQHVLDLGCGTGNVAVAMLAKDTTVKVDAVDWSKAMLAYIPRKTHDERLKIRRYDALQYLQMTHRCYDVIVLNNVVYTIANRELFWRLLAQRLNDGGRIVVAHPDTANSGSLLRDHIEQRSFASLLRPRLIMIGMFDAVISALGMSRHYAFTTQDTLLQEVASAGLELEGEVGRCYGGHVRGIDLLFTLKKS